MASVLIGDEKEGFYMRNKFQFYQLKQRISAGSHVTPKAGYDRRRKILDFVAWVRSLRRVRALFPVDPPFDQTPLFLDFLGLDYERAQQLAEAVCTKNDIRYSRLYSSSHFLAFASLKASGFTPKNILEIGTGSGQTTRVLADLFPKANVHTIELPLSDPIYGENAGGFNQEQRNQFLDLPRITAHSCNSAFMFDIDLPDFDLIWLDGGHVFPEVAWDHFYCLSKLRPGGWVFTDDIRFPDNPLYRIYEGSTDAYETLAYYAKRTTHRSFFLIKRTDLHRNLFDPKYVAALHKTDT